MHKDTATGDVVVTKNEAGQIVAVTRQDEDGRILSVIAECAAPAREPAQLLTEAEIHSLIATLSDWKKYTPLQLYALTQRAFAKKNIGRDLSRVEE